MFDDFKQYILSEKGYFTDFTQMSIKMTEKLFNIINNINSHKEEILKIKKEQLLKNKFYLIKYNYNGNNIWCPILGLEYKVVNNKNIYYAINIEYLPVNFKLEFFKILFNNSKSTLIKNVDKKNPLEELPLPYKFEKIYMLLKNNKMDFALTAFDINKIKDIYSISFKISPVIVMSNCKKINNKDMRKMIEQMLDSKEKQTLIDINEQYQKLIEEYEENSIEYHKKLKLFEKYLKIIE
jgi:hypothetical protein